MTLALVSCCPPCRQGQCGPQDLRPLLLHCHTLRVAVPFTTHADTDTQRDQLLPDCRLHPPPPPLTAVALFIGNVFSCIYHHFIFKAASRTAQSEQVTHAFTTKDNTWIGREEGRWLNWMRSLHREGQLLLSSYEKLVSIIQGNFFFLNKKKGNKDGQDKETAIRDFQLPVKQFGFLKSCSLCDISFSVCWLFSFLFFFNLLIQKNKVICPACLENLIDGAKGRHVRDQRKNRFRLKNNSMDSKHIQRNSILLQKLDLYALCIFCWLLTHFIV